MTDNETSNSGQILEVQESAVLVPTTGELAVLNSTEKFGFELAHRMNQRRVENFLDVLPAAHRVALDLSGDLQFDECFRAGKRRENFS